MAERIKRGRISKETQATLGSLGSLTIGESLMIARRRTGKTQSQAAKEHGVSYVKYSGWERDLSPGPEIQVLPLAPHERCLLYRRRAKVTQHSVAAGLGCCRWWVNQMERGVAPCDDLLWYWEQ